MNSELLIEAVRSEYNRFGYVQWSDVARTLGCSRQHVHNTVQKAVDAGSVTEAEQTLWSKSYLVAATRKLRVTPDNWDWLEAEAERLGRSRNDILNELLNRERFLSSTSLSQSNDNNTDQDHAND